MTAQRLHLLACAMACLAACRIPGDHFIGTGGDGDGGGSGDGGGGDGRGPDGPPAVASNKGWIVDQNGALHRVSKNAAGALTVIQNATTSVPSPAVAVASKQGTHLLVGGLQGAANGAAFDYAIAMDGTLTAGPIAQLGACQPTFMLLHPNGNFLVVGCRSQELRIIKVIGGVIDAASVTSHPLSYPPAGGAFDTGGGCLFLTDGNAAATANVYSLAFDASQGIAADVAPAFGPSQPSGVAANGQYVYFAGEVEVYAFAIGAGCGMNLIDSRPYPAAFAGAARTVMTPSNDRLFVALGSRVNVFELQGGGQLLSAPVPSTDFPGFNLNDIVMDPALPGIVYLTVSSGTFPATVSSTGALTMGTIASPTGIGNGVGFAMAP